jgi:hypothetical protein
VTEARVSKSEDISSRERRYLMMMGVRVACFILSIVVFVNGGGWLTAIPAVGAIIIPYFAVVIANGGRELNGGRGFQAHEPNLPSRFSPAAPGPGMAAGPTVAAPPEGPTGDSGNSGESASPR